MTAQTPAKLVNNHAIVDYQGTADVKAGYVVLLGNIPFVAPSLLDYSEQVIGTLECCGRVYDMPQNAEQISGGDIVYLDATGTPVTGDASSGGITATSGSNKKFGIAAPLQPNGNGTTLTTDSYVRVIHMPWAA